MNTEEGNKLIAEFMGCKIAENKYLINILPFYGETDITGLWYHTSWDWLMPVIWKIAELKDDRVIKRAELTTEADIIFCLHLMCDIKKAWECVIEFINWYDKNKKNTMNKLPDKQRASEKDGIALLKKMIKEFKSVSHNATVVEDDDAEAGQLFINEDIVYALIKKLCR